MKNIPKPVDDGGMFCLPSEQEAAGFEIEVNNDSGAGPTLPLAMVDGCAGVGGGEGSSEGYGDADNQRKMTRS